MELRDPEPPAEQPADSEEQPSHEPSGRRHPSTVGGALYLLVLTAASFGLAIVATGDWRVGVRWIGGALIAAAIARLLVPTREAGMLAVRRRAIDITLLTVVGVALLFLASSIPNQPPL